MIQNSEEIANIFADELENNFQMKLQFLRDNFSNFVWKRSGTYLGEPVNFWAYGPEIPNANFIIHVCSAWYTAMDGWAYRFYGESVIHTQCATFEEVKKLVEEEASFLYANTS